MSATVSSTSASGVESTTTHFGWPPSVSGIPISPVRWPAMSSMAEEERPLVTAAVAAG